jgi:ubiquinone/menaquinone biosynthesis C-methylase UbiE
MATSIEPGIQTEIAFLTQPLAPGMRVLDAGCGSGILLDAAARAVGSAGAVVGLDVSPEALAVSRLRSALNRNCGVEWADLARGIPWSDDSFDAVLCHRLLEELPDPEAFVRDAARVLRPGGAVVAVLDEAMAPGAGGSGHHQGGWLEGILAAARGSGLSLEDRGRLHAEGHPELTVIGLRARKQRNGTA